jgi:hypothetical protein
LSVTESGIKGDVEGDIEGDGPAENRTVPLLKLRSLDASSRPRRGQCTRAPAYGSAYAADAFGFLSLAAGDSLPPPPPPP